MAKFLTTAAVTYQVERIILESKKKLVLVSPYIKITKTFLERLRDASDRGVIVSIVFGKEELKSSEKKQIDSIPNLKLYFLSNLHAKCYFNESEMVITSMNLYEFSERNNREMGIFVTKKLDIELFSDAVSETHSIIKAATPIVAVESLKPASNSFTVKEETSKGYCIRCKDSIKNNLKEPYCKICHSNWEYWANPEFKEKYCHTCGSICQTTILNGNCQACTIIETILPLQKEDYKKIVEALNKKFTSSKINCTATYVFCKEMLVFANVMIREGFEIRFKHNLFNETAFLDKLKSLNLMTLHYNYDIKTSKNISNEPYYAFIPQKVTDLKVLIEDYVKLINIINKDVQSLSTKQGKIFM